MIASQHPAPRHMSWCDGGCCPAHPVWLVSCCAGDGGYLQVPAQPSSHDQSSQVRGREQTAPVMWPALVTTIHTSSDCDPRHCDPTNQQMQNMWQVSSVGIKIKQTLICKYKSISRHFKVFKHLRPEMRHDASMCTVHRIKWHQWQQWGYDKVDNVINPPTQDWTSIKSELIA